VPAKRRKGGEWPYSEHVPAPDSRSSVVRTRARGCAPGARSRGDLRPPGIDAERACQGRANQTSGVAPTLRRLAKVAMSPVLTALIPNLPRKSAPRPSAAARAAGASAHQPANTRGASTPAPRRAPPRRVRNSPRQGTGTTSHAPHLSRAARTPRKRAREFLPCHVTRTYLEHATRLSPVVAVRHVKGAARARVCARLGAALSSLAWRGAGRAHFGLPQTYTSGVCTTAARRARCSCGGIAVATRAVPTGGGRGALRALPGAHWKRASATLQRAA
jgi:hypothetical protein